MNCLENGPPPIEKGYGLVSIKSVSVSVSVSLSLSQNDRCDRFTHCHRVYIVSCFI